MKAPYRAFGVCPVGLEAIVVDEMKTLDLGLDESKMEANYGGVYFSCNQEQLMGVLMASRTLSRVVVQMREFAAAHEVMLYDQIKRLPWESFLTPESTFCISAQVANSKIRNSHFVELKVKDAIVDRLRQVYDGRRPSVDTVQPDFRIIVFINNNRCILSLDATGDSLHRRGYRTEDARAPLKENLAAALLLAAGYDGSQFLLDPFCGSGTFLIEAALIASKTAPGLFRDQFACLKWPEFPKSAFLNQRQRLMEKRSIQPPSKMRLFGGDIDPRSVSAVQLGLRHFQLDRWAHVEKKDFRQWQAIAPEGLMVTNPPYGERIEVDGLLNDLYSDLGHWMKHQLMGWKAYILMSDTMHRNAVGLKPFIKIPVSNGSIQCQFNGYALYKGSSKPSPT